MSERTTILTTISNGVLTITLNRPKMYNAYSAKMYEEVGQELSLANTNDVIRAIVLTGSGKYYSSGNDLSQFMSGGDDLISSIDHGIALCKRFVEAFINCDKPIVAAVNGPALGIAVTSLGLCDFVYAVESATFKTPFVSLGQNPEACSSLVFYEIMGQKANELILLGKTFTAEEFYQHRVVHGVFPDIEALERHVHEVATQLADLPPQSMKISKRLHVSEDRRRLLQQVCEEEFIILRERILSEECTEAVLKFMMRKKPKL